MSNDLIQSLWNRGKVQEPKMSQQEINNLLAKSVRVGWSRLRANVWFLALMLSAALVFNILNVIAFASNPLWLGVHAGLTLITVVFLVVNFRVLRPLRGLDDASVELPALVRQQLYFFHSTLEWWMWVGPVTCWLLIFSLSVWMDQQDGQYRINHVGKFVAISAAIILGLYAVYRLAHYPLIQRTLAALHDLEAQVTEQTRRVQKQRKYWIVAGALLAIALTITAISGLVAWLAATE